ncbi:Septin spn4 [Coemansia sp. RSA 989]|nr:Septin spn4 [Coemansia sp. RSA 1086]KAJ1752677.1 Septin spn4 [Coemansia sp. RSA 1821]KAJ1867800.1 Septin spn4 [Coemansia sp. RSA 989]KAJ1874712.1 Septin spn4 [Coemansia sp. RSA 990]KAJ2633711.1 Septin spn4 [Coemansia sp. RSA 1290]KAJ2651339.1 Septin spn4 [Coemansia sp. RSA 1250]KAJ2673681.1 Septin spn4 [Coemansia sp. RSA 1085]
MTASDTNGSAKTQPSSGGIGIANLPNQLHKIVTKKGTNFSLMVVGESGTGKTTFINTLLTTELIEPLDDASRRKKQMDRTVDINIHKAELEEKMFSVKLNVVDTPGFGDYVDNNDCWLPVVDFIENQYEQYLRQEQQPVRKGIVDMRVHACLYFIRPNGHTLKPLDVRAMKAIGARVNLIPVIAKADTLSPAALRQFKKRIMDVIDAQSIRIYQPPIESEDEHSMQRNRDIISAMPFAIIGSDKEVRTEDGRMVKGRLYPWGVAEVENDQHCDFKKLRSLLIRTHMLDLISTTEEFHYDKYRITQMKTRKFGEPKLKKADNKKFREEEDNLRARFTEKVKLEENRFRQWEQRLIAERDRLNKDLEQEHNLVKQLESEIEALSNSGSPNGKFFRK